MDWIEVLKRIEGGEDDRTEFGRYRHFGEKDWLRPVCAFANSDGGLVVLGVTDDGRIEGVPMDPEKVQERATSSLQNALGGPVRARLGRHRDPAGWVHWIEVQRTRGSQPLKCEGVPLVRRGRSDVPPSESELQELYNTFGLVFTEERTIPGTGAADIDHAMFRTHMERRGIDIEAEPKLDVEEEYRRAEILGPGLDGALEATLYGILCFGREPQRPTPLTGFEIRMCAYGGMDRAAEVAVVGEARGRVDEQVRRAEDWVRGLGRGERYRGMAREDVPLVPVKALREALVNAVAHRDYTLIGERILLEVFDDRVEITSPGALPNHKSVESVMNGGPPRSRNESIAEFLVAQGLMERRGTGFPRMRAEMRRFNGTDPILETSNAERWVRVTLYRSPVADSDPGS